MLPGEEASKTCLNIVAKIRSAPLEERAVGA
jgi:hypothetical protein